MLVSSPFIVHAAQGTSFVGPVSFVSVQDGTQSYVTLLPKAQGLSTSPWLVYPTNSTIWVGGFSTGSPPISQVSEFFANGSSPKLVVTLPNLILSSVLPDPITPQTKIWFTENSTLAFFDTNDKTQTKAITLPGQSIEYLASDHQHRIWMSVLGSSGTGSIVMYDPSGRTNKTYPVQGQGTIIQGITVAPDDSIWFAEAGSKRIGHLSPASGSPPIEFTPPASVNLAAPIQVALDKSGNVWFTDHGSNQFGVLDPKTNDWKVFPIGYCPDNCIYGLPNSIFVDSSNIVWFSEHIAGRVGRYDPSTGTLTEYAVPGNQLPLMWWAMPGPNNLVWFVAWAFGQIGYVNASIPVSLSLSGPNTDLVVQRGSLTHVPVQVSSRISMTASFGISPLTQDQAFSSSTAQIYASPPSNITLDNNSRGVSFDVSAAWNATLGPRYVTLTASSGQISVSTQARIVVVNAAAPFVTLGFAVATVIAGPAFLLRRPKKSKQLSSKKNRG